MKPVALFGIVLWGLAGCASIEPVPPGTLTKQEVAVREMNLQGLKIGDKTSTLRRFAQVQKVPYGRTDYEVYDIYNPNPHISLAKAYFAGNVLKRLELFYFDGPTTRTLSRSGGWAGLKEYLVSKFGPPSREGKEVALATDEPGLKASQSKFNGVWIFSRQNRQLNFVADSDAKAGVAVVTLQDTTPAPVPAPAPKTGTVRVVRVSQKAPPTSANPAPQATLNEMPLRPADPGF